MMASSDVMRLSSFWRNQYIRPVLLICFLSFLLSATYSQQFGGTPSYEKWEQLRLQNGRVLFPQNTGSTAKRIATIISRLQEDSMQPLATHPRNFNVVLRADQMQSNGYVQLGPFRSEFFLSPPQNVFQLGSQEWAATLSLHEFRHVEQYNAFNTGLSNLMATLFGQDGQALANAAAVPDWFFEGDAVYNESLLSPQGRGKLPAFFNGYRSLFFDGKNYSYQQLRNGSFRHFTPDYYELGYLLTTFGREKFGPDFWEKVTKDAAAFKPLIYPLQGAIKRYSGLRFSEFVNEAFAYYHNQWKSEDDPQKITWLTKVKKNDVVNYRYPYAAESGDLIVLKSSKRQIPAFYKIRSDGSEEKIAEKNISIDDYFSFNNGKIIYSTYQPNARWASSYSQIVIVDLESGEERFIARKTKFVSPDISHDGATIVAVHNAAGEPVQLVLLDAEGRELKTFQAASDGMIYYPKFSKNDSSVYYFQSVESGEMRLMKQDLYTAKSQVLLPYSNRISGFPVVVEDGLVFSCTNNGRDEIWMYDEKKETLFRMVSHTTGIYQAVLTGKDELLFSAFTADGYRLGTAKPLWEQTEPSELKPLFVSKSFPANSFNFIKEVKDGQYPLSSYPKASHPFNFHSWYPYFDDPDYSFNIYGNNVLNTIQSQISYTYNNNEKSHGIGVSGIFGGSYVMPFIGLGQTWNRTARSADHVYHLNELEAFAGVSLPLNFSMGNHFRSLNISSSYNLIKQHWTGLARGKFEDAMFNYLDSRILFSSQTQTAEQQIFPARAQSVQLRFRNLIAGDEGFQFLGKASVYIPGVIKTHSLVLNVAYQLRDTLNNYSFSNDFPFSRGYAAVNYPQMWKASANYHLPLFYPDWGFGNIVYFKRIRTNLFYDYSKVKSKRTGQKLFFPSAGAEFYFDTRWWNQHPLSFGFRYSRKLNKNVQPSGLNQWEIILPVAILR